MEKLNVTVSGETTQLEIRTGEALPLKEPRSLKFAGAIESVSRFLGQRKDTIDHKKCRVEIDPAAKKIILVIDEGNHYAGEVIGKLEMDPVFVEFGINSTKKWDLRTLSDFIKMHRSFFTNKQDAMKLVELLRNFKGKVDKAMEQSSDTRGNKKVLLDQVVTSNIPDAFTLKMPVFKNGDIKTFNVEVNIIPRDQDMECYLESVEAADIIKDESENVIQDEVTKIEGLCPDLVILYV
jgi:hypothetical protein